MENGTNQEYGRAFADKTVTTGQKLASASAAPFMDFEAKSVEVMEYTKRAGEAGERLSQ